MGRKKQALTKKDMQKIERWLAKQPPHIGCGVTVFLLGFLLCLVAGILYMAFNSGIAKTLAISGELFIHVGIAVALERQTHGAEAERGNAFALKIPVNHNASFVNAARRTTPFALKFYNKKPNRSNTYNK